MKKLFILLGFCFLCACSRDPQPAQPSSVLEENRQIAADAFDAYQDGEDYWDAVRPNLQPLDPNSVYYVPKGKSYHSTDECVALLNSNTIINGTLEEACLAGKSDPCSKCVGD